jgi:CBS-domain-containing membrane protein
MRYVIYRETLIDKKDIWWSFLGSFLGIGIIGYLSNEFFPGTDSFFLIGSLGASAILIFGATNSPLAQPRNLIGGHLISAFIGVTIQQIIQDPSLQWMACGLAVSLSLIAMQITKTVHPPGGATALIANIGSHKIKDLGYFYVLSPVLTGVIIMLLIAVLINNIPSKRKYPYHKWF